MSMYATINHRLRRIIQEGSKADSTMCWTCSSCDCECPMNIATQRLRPQKIVRLANLGLVDDLLSLPEIWYCLSCRRCNKVCPNLVKPETLVRFARTAAILTGYVTYETGRKYYELIRQFQRVRWQAARVCMQTELGTIEEDQYQQWLQPPILNSSVGVPSTAFFKYGGYLKSDAETAKLHYCLTCGECSSVCPVAGERRVFDPRFIFRMVHLGLLDELLQSPSIWLCLACGRCTDVCSQQVDGCGIVRRLQDVSIQEAKTVEGFQWRWQRAQKTIYTGLVKQIDALFPAHLNTPRLPQSPESLLEKVVVTTDI
jgi:heterodisulfide reductase subunit C